MALSRTRRYLAVIVVAFGVYLVLLTSTYMSNDEQSSSTSSLVNWAAVRSLVGGTGLVRSAGGLFEARNSVEAPAADDDDDSDDDAADGEAGKLSDAFQFESEDGSSGDDGARNGTRTRRRRRRPSLRELVAPWEIRCAPPRQIKLKGVPGKKGSTKYEYVFVGHPAYWAFTTILHEYAMVPAWGHAPADIALGPPALLERLLTDPPSLVITRERFSLACPQMIALTRAITIVETERRRVFGGSLRGGVYAPLVSYVEGAFGTIGGPKAMQVVAKRRLALRHGCVFDHMGIQPVSYVTFDDVECAQLRERMAEDRLFVVKPSDGASGGGQGVNVTRGHSPEMAELYREVCVQRRPRRIVVQEYIEEPFLLAGSKFDMRAYMLIASTDPFVVYFRAGYIRRALVPYSKNNGTRAGHLTNSSVQEGLPDFNVTAHIWTMDRFEHYVESVGGAPRGWVNNTLIPRMKKIARLLFESARDGLRRRPGAFHFIGLDFMMDASRRVLFIEGNTSPGLGKRELSQVTGRGVFGTVIGLQAKGLPARALEARGVTAGFELIYDESVERCAMAPPPPAPSPAVESSATGEPGVNDEAYVPPLPDPYNVCTEFGAKMGDAKNAPGAVLPYDAILGDDATEYEAGEDYLAAIQDL